jgi:hypothetical protein
MFLAIVFIVLGVFLLLNAFGIIVSTNFWGLLWAVIFLAVGFKLLMRKGKCPLCGWGMWHDKMHGKMMGGHCCDHDRKEEHDEEEPV